MKLEMKIEEPTVQEHDKACVSITVEKDVDVLLGSLCSQVIFLLLYVPQDLSTVVRAWDRLHLDLSSTAVERKLSSTAGEGVLNQCSSPLLRRENSLEVVGFDDWGNGWSFTNRDDK